MELMATIENRRSIRKFTDQPVSDAQLRELFEAARLAPSAKNRQPWRFLVLRGEQKDHVANLMLRWFEDENREIPRYAKSAKYSAKTVLQAPVLIMVYREEDPVWEIGDILSIGAAMEHMCLKAEEMGLGTLWVLDTHYTFEESSRYLGTGDLIPVCSLAVGYADETPEARPRLPLEELFVAENERQAAE